MQRLGMVALGDWPPASSTVLPRSTTLHGVMVFVTDTVSSSKKLSMVIRSKSQITGSTLTLGSSPDTTLQWISSSMAMSESTSK